MGNSRLLQDLAAEKEANEIGSKFMQSSDVVSDMSNEYGVDFSNVSIHHDESAAGKVSERGVDAFASGNDIFFGRGVLESNSPESRGLLAHELTHTMQQDGADGVSQSAPEGAEQGGLISWFKSLFGKKKQPEPEMQVSEPTLVPDGPFTVQEDIGRGRDSTHSYQSQRSQAIKQMVDGATPEQLRDPKVQQLIIDDYNKSMNQRLKGLSGASKEEMDSQAFRGGAGELLALNTMMKKLLPEGFHEDLRKQAGDDPERAMDYMREYIAGDETMSHIMTSIAPSFDGVAQYANPEDQSAMMMNNFALRNVAPIYGEQYSDRQEVEYQKLAGMKANKGKSKAEIQNMVPVGDKSGVIFGGKLQKAINRSNSPSAQRYRSLFTSRYRR